MTNNAKTVLVVVSLIVVIILSGSLTLYYLHRSSDELEKSIDDATILVESKKWDPADKLLNDFEVRWNTTKYTWSILLDHFEIDNIDNSYTKAKEYVKSKDLPSAMAELKALKQYIEHIPKKEGFSLKNIL
jgi:hypothetical protein